MNQLFTNSHLQQLEEVQFWIGNPAVELTNGKLYFSTMKSNLVVCISIPNSQQPVEFCDFLSEHLNSIKELKVLMVESTQHYAVLMQFIDENSAQICFDLKQGTMFNPIEEDICILHYVKKITLEDTDNGKSIFFKKPKFTKKIQGNKKQQNNYDSGECTICFESLSNGDEKKFVTIISILCSHYFHLKCLLQWNQPVCPLCRYDQQPPEVSFCEVCSNAESLWICLTCGAKFCTEHRGSHIKSHALFLNINNKLVWDTVSMNYVHRTLLSEFGGKLVQYEGTQMKDYESKLDEFMKEQEQLLYTSLDSQRVHFEQLINELNSQDQRKVDQLETQIKQLSQEEQDETKIISELQKQLNEENDKFAQMKQNFLQSHQLKCKLEKENHDLVQEIKMQDQQKDIIKNQQIQEVNNLNRQINEIEEEIQELQKNLKLKQKVQKQGLNEKDLTGSQMIFIGQQSQGKNRKKKGN